MRLPRRKFLQLAAGAAALPALARGARAPFLRREPITVVVPFPAGGPTDAIVRIMGERMRLSLGQPLIVEYVTGASGTIGLGRVARAAPDGYTMLIGHLGTNVIVPALAALSVRCGERLHAARAAAEQSIPAGDEEFRSGEYARRADRLGEGEPGKDFGGNAGRQTPSRTSRASLFRTSPAHTSRSCPIAARRRRCRT